MIVVLDRHKSNVVRKMKSVKDGQRVCVLDGGRRVTKVASRVGLINEDILLNQWLVQVIRQSQPWQAEIGFALMLGDSRLAMW